MVFVFDSVYMMDYIYRFAYVEPALHLWGEADLIVMNNLIDMLLQLVCQYFIEDFCIDVHHGYWPQDFFFLVEYLPDFGIRMMLVS